MMEIGEKFAPYKGWGGRIFLGQKSRAIVDLAHANYVKSEPLL